MQQFIVLGLIPGTNIQIGFAVVAAIILVISLLVLRRFIRQYREVRHMVSELTERRPVPARAYHTRTPLF